MERDLASVGEGVPPIFRERRFRVRHRSAGGQHCPQSSPSFSFQIGPRATCPNPPTSCRHALRVGQPRLRRLERRPIGLVRPMAPSTFGRWVYHPGDMPTRRQHKTRLRARQLCDPPGRAPGHDVVLLSADRVDVLPNSAQIDGLTEKREFARLDQIVRVITAMACLRRSVRQQARRSVGTCEWTISISQTPELRWPA
jgi:hypothetical protein